jgi:hypothetical protein
MKIKIMDDLVVNTRDIIGLNDDEWRDNIVERVGSVYDIKSGPGIFLDCSSTLFYNINYKEIIIENGIIILKDKTK